MRKPKSTHFIIKINLLLYTADEDITNNAWFPVMRQEQRFTVRKFDIARMFEDDLNEA
jgi:hypothetical protein